MTARVARDIVGRTIIQTGAIMRRHVYGVMATMTTYGTWLRGDARGWVDEGRIWPPDPNLEAADRERMTHPVFLFDAERWFEIGAMIGNALIERERQRVLALSVQVWHVHFVVAESEVPIANVVKCAKEGVRYGLRIGRPIWTEKYDRRFCFTKHELAARVAYVGRHNVERGRPAKPWPFIE